MFDKFGEFDSAEELNMAAEGLFNEGDTDSILVLAEENGIPKELAEAYITGELPVLADPSTAAMGKIDVELPALEKEYGQTAECVAEYVKSICGREEFARHVRRKGKSLAQCLAAMYSEAKKQVDQGKKNRWQCACIPPAEGYRIIRDYYTGGKKA